MHTCVGLGKEFGVERGFHGYIYIAQPMWLSNTCQEWNQQDTKHQHNMS